MKKTIKLFLVGLFFILPTTPLFAGGTETFGGGNGYLLNIPTQAENGAEAYRVYKEVKAIGNSIVVILKRMKTESSDSIENILKPLGSPDVDQFIADYQVIFDGLNRIRFNPSIPNGDHAQYNRVTQELMIDPVTLPWLREDPSRYAILVYHESLGLLGYGDLDLKKDNYPSAHAFREEFLKNADNSLLVKANLLLADAQCPKASGFLDEIPTHTISQIQTELSSMWGLFQSASEVQSYLLNLINQVKQDEAPRVIRLIPVVGTEDRKTQDIVRRETKAVHQGEIILADPVQTFITASGVKSANQNSQFGIRDPFVSAIAHVFVILRANAFLDLHTLKYMESEEAAMNELNRAVWYFGMDLGKYTPVKELWKSVREVHPHFSDRYTEEIALLYDSVIQADNEKSAYRVLEEAKELSFTPTKVSDVYRRQSNEIANAIWVQWLRISKETGHLLQISDWLSDNPSDQELLMGKWTRYFSVSNILNSLQIARIVLSPEDSRELHVLVSINDLVSTYSLLEYLRAQSGGAIELHVDRAILESESQALRKIIPSTQPGRSWEYSGDELKKFLNSIP